MTSQGLSRAVRLIPQSRCWLNRSRCTIPHQTSAVLPQFCQHRCSSSQTPNKMPSSTRGGVGDDGDDAPIPYTSSKALRWSVHNSYGRHKKRPWYKVAPISIGLTLFMAWVFLREETEIDRQLEVHLHERLPGMFPDPTKRDNTAAPTASSQEDPDDTSQKEEE